MTNLTLDSPLVLAETAAIALILFEIVPERWLEWTIMRNIELYDENYNFP